MNKKLLIVALIVSIFLLFNLIFSLNPKTEEVGKTECVSDTDCVPSGCCHSNSCINKIDAQNCSGIFCTMDCKPGTLDCGQGSCQCLQGICQAVLQ